MTAQRSLIKKNIKKKKNDYILYYTFKYIFLKYRSEVVTSANI